MRFFIDGQEKDASRFYLLYMALVGDDRSYDPKLYTKDGLTLNRKGSDGVQEHTFRVVPEKPHDFVIAMKDYYHLSDVQANQLHHLVESANDENFKSALVKIVKNL